MAHGNFNVEDFENDDKMLVIWLKFACSFTKNLYYLQKNKSSFDLLCGKSTKTI